MDKMKKGRLAKRAKSFKEDILDILSNLRPSNGGTGGGTQVEAKVKPLPISNLSTANGSEPKNELLCVLENLPASIALNQHFTNEINKNILQVRFALKFYEDVVVKNTLEMVPGSASVVLETVFNILTTLGNVFPAGEHSSRLISATNLVHQALAQLIRWSDDILLHSTANGASSQRPSNNAESSAPSQYLSEVRTVVDGLKMAVNDLVQVVIHKAANKIPPPSTAVVVQPSLYESNSLRLYGDAKDGSVDGLMPPASPNKRMSKSSDGSILEDIPGSADWSSDSLPEDLADHSPPPPKPPLPLKSIFGDPGDMGSFLMSVQDPLTPPPLPPKKRSLVGGAGSGLSPLMAPSSPFNPIAWHTNPLMTLPDLVPTGPPWLNESFDSLAHANLLAMQEMFERQHLETRFEASKEQRNHVSMATSSTSVFSSSSSSSFSSYNLQQQQHQQQLNTSSSSGFQFCSKVTSSSQEQSTMTSLSVPPALPVKRRQRAANTRLPSQYDNLDQFDAAACSSPSSTSAATTLADFVAVKQEESSEAFHFSEEKRFQSSGVHTSSSSSSGIHLRREFSHMEAMVTSTSASSSSLHLGEAPPLPPKKRHIKAYMEMVGPYSQPSEVELFRQTMEAYHHSYQTWREHSEDLFLTRASSYLTAPPPILPPKRNKLSTSSTNTLALPSGGGARALGDTPNSTRPNSEALSSPPATPTPRPALLALTIDKAEPPVESVDVGMEQLDLSADLILKQPEDEGPEVRGGGLDALITHAAKLNKDDYLYQAAFLATYRTFITPLELTRKLIHRFHFFLRKPDIGNQRAARCAFSLLVGVVDDLALSELQEKLMRQIIDFQSQLVGSGDLVLAKALRKKFLEKCTARRLRANPIPPVLASLGVSTRTAHLLDWKSGELAEQLSLLDAELFLRIEVPEVLVWAQEQNEEKSPNLTLFTEHFNKMSYWARSRILEQGEPRDRERLVVKFIKIMKHLRRLNNFNSYLALLSALDSAPIRRLEWQKSITDGLQEYCALIDSSSSFRAYRQALAETQPPCIPYIGLILQDLTFVHIGNPDTLTDGRINFGKRWQQFHILENMRRFQKCHYPFKRNDRIVAFFNEFNDYLCEESMWQISESIRPRGSNAGSGKK